MSLCSRLVPLRMLVLAVVVAMAEPVAAASIYVDVVGVVGADPIPAHPAAMAVQKLAIAPHELMIQKAVDAASPSIAMALIDGTLLPSAFALFYDIPPPGARDAVLSFHDLLVSSSQTIGHPVLQLEQVIFGSANPELLYLELPGVIGESSAPGHPGVMALRSFSTDGSSFEVVKPLDAASPAIELAVIQGTLFETARLLLYDSPVPGAAPDGELVFHGVFASSSQPESGGGAVPLERDGFAFVSLTPEPASGALGIAVAGVLAVMRRTDRGMRGSRARRPGLRRNQGADAGPAMRSTSAAASNPSQAFTATRRTALHLPRKDAARDEPRGESENFAVARWLDC